LSLFKGGYDRGECLNLVEAYDVETNSWSPLPSMKHNRGRFDITCINNEIVYAVAGSNGQAEIASVEKYDARVGKWSKVASLPVNLSNIGNECKEWPLEMASSRVWSPPGIKSYLLYLLTNPRRQC
jgi:Kelch motif